MTTSHATRTAIVVFLAAAAWSADPDPRLVIPDGTTAANIRDFGAKGDGTTDDSAAFRKALGKDAPRLIYLPAGTYLVRESFVYGVDDKKKKKKVTIVGESRDRTIIRLADNSPGFNDPKKPRAVINTRHPKQQGEQNMHNHLQGFTIEIGRGNPGAIGLAYHTNNTGMVEDLRIRAVDPGSRGAIGLACHEWEVGPGSLRHIEVDGFATGIALTRIGNYITAEDLVVRNCDLAVDANTSTIRSLRTENCGKALNANGRIVLLDSHLAGKGPVAVEVTKREKGSGSLLARNLKIVGFEAAITADGKTVKESTVAEWTSAPGLAVASGGATTGLQLPIEETPRLPYPAAGEWAVMPAQGDISDALQKAIDDGRKDILLQGDPVISKTITVRGATRRIAGLGNVYVTCKTGTEPVLRIADGDAPVVLLDFLYQQYGSATAGVEHASRRTVVMRRGSLSYASAPAAKGAKAFVENVVCGRLRFANVDAWCRDVNLEGGGKEPTIVNDGGSLWILGMKTEDYATKIHTKGGGRTELLGGAFRANHDKSDFTRNGLDPANPPPLFLVEDGQASFTYVTWGPAIPFDPHVRLVQGGTTSDLRKDKVQGAVVVVAGRKP